MDIRAKRNLTTSAAVLLLCVGLAGPAAAAQGADPIPVDDTVINTVPPAEPEEEVTDVPDAGNGMPDEPTVTPAPPKDWPNAEYCGPGHGYYKPTAQGKRHHKGVGPTLANYNGTSRTAKSTFTSEVTGEVGVSVTTGLQVSIDTMLTKIEGKFDVTLHTKVTAKLGNSITVDTPSHRMTNAKYGVYRLKHTGVSYYIYSNCNTSTHKTITSYSPFKAGWYLWES